MRQYTTPEQTAKLIELGFETPKFEIETQLCNIKGQPLRAATIVGDYSIGELIEMLDGVSELEITRFGSGWGVYDELRAFTCEELIDALYDMVVKLKEEGVI
jgi:hypothetical protein